MKSGTSPLLLLLVGAVLGGAAMFGYQQQSSGVSACEAFYSLAQPMAAQTNAVGRTSTSSGVLNPGTDYSYVGVLILTDYFTGQGQSGIQRHQKLKNLYDRCAESAD